MADIAHKYNAHIILDLIHQGLIAVEQPAYSPSGDKGFYNKELQSKAMTKEDISMIQDYFVQGAIRAQKAGFDGIEIHGAQLNLVSLFSTKKYNRRTDEYGGSDENRAKFIVEIVKKIREAVDKDFIISAKIDIPDEENGITESGFIYMAKALEEVGLDLMEVSGPNIGGIKKYEQADFILKNSNIEYIAMSRELLKQPDIVKKWYLNKK